MTAGNPVRDAISQQPQSREPMDGDVVLHSTDNLIAIALCSPPSSRLAGKLT